MMDYSRVVFFQTNRVWRVYTGGKLLEKLQGMDYPRDDSFPEDWLASTTPAQNREHQQSPDEGLSYILNPDGSRGISFREYLKADPEAALGTPSYHEDEGVGVLCKFLDSAIRLPIQCHPDIPFARKHYGSDHGKAEAWMILGTREIDGTRPYLLMGFKPGVTPDAFRRAVESQEIPAMEQMLHKVPVRPGEMYFIPGRFPHAIGPGVFLLEIQEPTDWVVQPEKHIGEVELSDADMWGPLDPDTGLACFDYKAAADIETTLQHVRIEPMELDRSVTKSESNEEDGRLFQILDRQRTGCFEVRRLDLNGTYRLEGGGYVGIATDGEITMQDPKGKEYRIRGGCSFFVPFGIEWVEYESGSPATIYLTSGKTSE
jgi:mannose-6-phosphate isomerase